MKYIIIHLIILLSGVCVHAQQIHFSMDEASKTKINQYNAKLKNSPEVKVYRIQYAVNSDRRVMENELRNFKSQYDIVTDWHQNGPYFYMKAGHFRTKFESFQYMHSIKDKYPGAIYVVESVEKKDLFKKQ